MPDDDIASDLEVTITAIDPPKGPRPKIKWQVHERGPGDPPDTFLSYADLAATEEADAYKVYPHKLYEPPNRRGYTCINVLPELRGRAWDAAALNLMQALRPSAIRVIGPDGFCTADATHWRVSVFLEDDNRTIRRIEQEVEVGLRGCRYGQDVSAYLDGKLAPDGSGNEVVGYFNVASIMKLELYSDKEKADEDPADRS